MEKKGYRLVRRLRAVFFILVSNSSHSLQPINPSHPQQPQRQHEPFNTLLLASNNAPIIDTIETERLVLLEEEKTRIGFYQDKQENIQDIIMTTAEVSNEMIQDSNIAPEASNDAKRKLTSVISSPALDAAAAAASPAAPKQHNRTLSHSVSFIGDIDVLPESKGREEYASDIPSNAVNLCSASFGARVLFATDEWFAKADNLLKDSPAEFDEDAYCEQVGPCVCTYVLLFLLLKDVESLFIVVMLCYAMPFQQPLTRFSLFPCSCFRAK